MPMAPLRVFLQKAVLRRLPEYTLLQVPRSLSISGWPRSDWDTTEQAIAESSWFKNEAKTSTAPEEFCSTNSQCLKWYDHRPLEGRRMRSGPTQEYSALVQHWAVPMEAVNGSCHRTKVSQRSSTYLEEQTASLKQPIAGGAWQHPGHPGQKVALGLGSASIFDGRGGRALSCQSFSASSSLTFGGDGRRFHSTPPHSSWFWPSNGGERLPPSSSDAPLLQESDQTQSDGTFPEPDSNLTEHLPDTAKVSLEALREGALESAPTAAGWGVWKALAPISGAIVVALDGVHSITGLPWWSTIIVSTLLMRTALLPLVAVQIQKTAQIGSLFSQVLKLGGPETPFLTQIQRFAAARQATKCPNPAWFLAVPAVQIPIFVSSMLALREMTASGHPGFDTGGMLWFTDLTLPAGLGLEAAIFPVAIVSLYLANVQLAFGGIGPRGRLLKVYKFVLQALAVPAFVGSFYLPQGLLLYWVTNNCCSLGQNLAVRSSAVRSALGLPRLPDRKPPGTEPEAVPITDEMIAKMDVNELLRIAATCQAQRRPEEAVKFLKKALARSPEEATIFYALGKTHVGLRKWEEAAEYHGQAAGYAQDDELRGKALYGLGIAIFNQGKVSEAVAALREAAALQPDDLEAQLSLASVLSRNGDKAEALEVVRKAVRLEPKLQKYIEELEKEIRTQADAANEAEGRR